MSDTSLDSLISKVKSEAIEAAKKESDAMISEAKKRAEKIMEEALKKKELMLEEAGIQAEEIVQKGESAMQQAARDIQVSVKNDLMILFDNILTSKVKEAFSPDLIQSVISSIITNVGNNTTVKIPENSQQELIDIILDQLKHTDSVSIIKEKGLLQGMTITKDHEGWSYSVTPEEIASVMNSQLSKKWVDILNKRT